MRSQHHNTREGGERELFTLWSRPQIYSPPAAPPGQQLPRFTASFCPWNRHQFALYAQSWFWRTGELLSPRPELHKEKCFETQRKPISAFSYSPPRSSVLIARSWTGYQSHVQEEGSERQRELQESQGVAKQWEDGERSGRRCRSVLRTGLSQQTLPQQQRRVLWHRLQGEPTERFCEHAFNQAIKE